MVTSLSPEIAESWKGEAALFSGRPDPAWQIDREAAGKLVSIWNALPAWKRPVPCPPALGWRGAILTAPDGQRWTVFGGVVNAGGRSGIDSRHDESGEFLRTLLATAPHGVIPEGAVPE